MLFYVSVTSAPCLSVITFLPVHVIFILILTYALINTIINLVIVKNVLRPTPLSFIGVAPFISSPLPSRPFPKETFHEILTSNYGGLLITSDGQRSCLTGRRCIYLYSKDLLDCMSHFFTIQNRVSNNWYAFHESCLT